MEEPVLTQAQFLELRSMELKSRLLRLMSRGCRCNYRSEIAMMNHDVCSACDACITFEVLGYGNPADALAKVKESRKLWKQEKKRLGIK